MKTKLIFTIVTVSLLSISSFGAVNMRNGSYTEKWIDLVSPGKGYPLEISRYYSSRSLFIGIFGFGWCSQLETNLEPTTNGDLLLTDCGGGLETSYYPEKFDPVSAKSTTEKILKSMKASPRDISTVGQKKLKERLLANAFERFNLARKYHIIDGKKIRNKTQNFISKRSKLDRIHFNGKFYLHKRKNGEYAKYDGKGKLIQLINRSGKKLNISYRGTKISFIADEKGQKLQFTYGNDGRVQKISDGRGLSSVYTFRGEDLIEVTNAWRNTYFFDYDNYHNMVKATFPGGSFIQMTYDTRRDWIKNFSDRVKCKDAYSFTISQDRPKDHYWSNLDRQCPQDRTLGKYEFWYESYVGGKGKFLNRVKTEVGQDTVDSTLHPLFGDPLRILENQSLETFSYSDLGLKKASEYHSYDGKKRLLETTKSIFNYNKTFEHVKNFQRSVYDAKKKLKQKDQTTFQYAKSGYLKKAKLKTGKTVSVLWNPSGQISSLKGLDGSSLQLKYSVDFPKPRVIQSNKGSIEISYTPTGEIRKVKSSKGKAIASQIVQSFIRYIDIIGPGVEGLEI